MYKLIFYVPDSHVEQVKQAVFLAGAGRPSEFGNYDHCSWQVLGQGQFRPLSGAKPHIGQVDKLEQVAEWRVETILPKHKLAGVLKAMKAAHPYEQPAFDVIELISW